MKFKFKCVNIFEHAHTGTVLIKFSPVDAPAGDLLLAVEKGEIKWHPEVRIENKAAGTFKIATQDNEVITGYTVGGQTFEVGKVYEVSVVG